MKRMHLIASAMATVAFAASPAAASHSWGGYHWARSKNPLVLRINTSITSTWSSYVATAVTDWDKSTVIDFESNSAASLKYFPVSASAKRCDPIAGQVLVCNASYGQRGWLGIASIWANGDHITQATTKLNDSYFSMSSYNTPAWRALVTCQEIGHDFGLAHQDENFSNPNLNTCMDYTNLPASNQHPNQHDYDMLQSIYSHLDSTNTAVVGAAATNFGIRQVGKPVPQTDGGVGDTMADWGRAIHQDGRGRPDMFMRRLADGRTVVTHVFWAPDAKGTEAN